MWSSDTMEYYSILKKAWYSETCENTDGPKDIL